MARSVRVDLVADSARFVRGMRDAQRSSERFSDHTNRAGKAVRTAFAAFSAAAVVVEMRKWVVAARDANRTATQTDAVIRSTQGASKLSAKGFSDLAKQISKTAAVDDDLIQGGENILATFTKIRAGGPDKVFERATSAAVDMAAALNHGEVSAEGLQSANLVLGKALQDPIAGLTRLQRIGVSFDETQKQQIKRFVEAGEVAKAQGVILAEVNKEFGGSAAAAVTPAKRLAVAWGDMQEVLGNLLIPAIDRAATIMTGILEVVDANRKAFGLLFGVLGTGAAVIGGLIVAEKIHRAVVDATRVATEAWAAVQKGLNVVLGTTKVQAATTAVAQEGLAASTGRASAAAASAQGAWAALGGSVAIGTAAILGANEAAKHTTSTQNKWIAGILRSLGPMAFLAESFDKQQEGAKDSAKATTDNSAALAKLIPQQQAAAEKTAATAAKSAELTGKLKDLKQEFRDQAQAVEDSVKAYDGLITKSDVTTKQVITDLHNQVANFKTYAKDTQRLIKAGVNPAAIEELSKKGPQFVHALAVGSNRELQTYKGYWKARQDEIKGSFAKSMDAQYAKLKRTIEDMQNKINKLSGKTIYITAQAAVTINASVRGYLKAANVPGFHARGTLLPGYGGGDIVPAMLEPGEAVVPKDKARRPEFRAWARAQGIPGFQRGGPVGWISQFDDKIGSATSRVGQRFADNLAGMIGRGLSKAIEKGLAGGSPAIKRFISSTDPLPYQWGAAGPRAYDCSGLVSAVLGKMTGRGGGQGQRYFTTASIHSGILGIKPGLGGVLQIGVTPGQGHMAGRYGGLGFEARSTASGIITGGGARDPASFARHYHLAKGGQITRDMAAAYATLAGLDVGGDQGRLRVNGRTYDQGGWLMPGATLAVNRTGRPERVLKPGNSGATVELHFHGPVVGGQRGAEELAALVQTELLARKRRQGGIALGLG